MITRRTLISSLAAIGALTAAPAMAQDADPFEWAFSQLTEMERRNVQVELQMAGLYTANVDGDWGPSTRRAIVNAPNYINAQSGDDTTVVLETYGDVTTLLKEIAQGQWSHLLYRESNEGLD